MTVTSKTAILGIALMGMLSGVTCLMGCSQGEYTPGQIQDTIAILRSAKADGQISFSFGGSPFQVGMKQTWFAGSENVVFSFSGKVDFTEPTP